MRLRADHDIRVAQDVVHISERRPASDSGLARLKYASTSVNASSVVTTVAPCKVWLIASAAAWLWSWSLRMATQ